jgi:hypothetical protein
LGRFPDTGRLSIELAPDEEQKLEEKARAQGQIHSDYVRELIRKELKVGPAAQHAKGKTFDEILAPIREGWEQSGLSEDQIMSLFEETRAEVRSDRRTKKEAP